MKLEGINQIERHTKFSTQKRMQRFQKPWKYSPSKLTSNKFVESKISGKIKNLKDEQNQQFVAKIEPKLDAYLRDENDEQVDDEHSTESHKQHPS